MRRRRQFPDYMVAYIFETAFILDSNKVVSLERRLGLSPSNDKKINKHT
jgi:hypothetical protein